MPNINYEWAHIKLSPVAINLKCVAAKNREKKSTLSLFLTERKNKTKKQSRFFFFSIIQNNN